MRKKNFLLLAFAILYSATSRAYDANTFFADLILPPAGIFLC